jgi:hypothetical protein
MCCDIRDSRDLCFYCEEGVKDSALSSYVLGSFMSVLLRLRGFLPLHASVVERNGIAVAFVGDSGWGKSTTAQYFVNAGYTLVDDDIAAVEINGTVYVRSGTNRIKLRPDAGHLLVDSYGALDEILEGAQKRVNFVGYRPRDSVIPLARIYLMFPQSAREVRITSGTPRQSMVLLNHHVRDPELIGSPAEREQIFKMTHVLVAQGLVRLLHRPRGIGHLAAIYSAVHDDLDNLS